MAWLRLLVVSSILVIASNFTAAITAGKAQAYTAKQLFNKFQSDGSIVLTESQCKQKYLFTQFDDPTQPQVTPKEAFDLDYRAINVIKWTPDGHSPRTMSHDCSPERFESTLLSTNNHQEFADKTREHFSTCKNELESNWPGSSQGLAKFVSTSYEFCEHPNIRKVHFRIDPFYKIRGYLALKEGRSKKPMVIIMCGAYCDSGDRTTRTTLMQTYDVGPFHALLLGNFTGGEFVADNNRVAIGGFEEGKKVYRIAKWLKQGPLSEVISTVHVIGMSLGGHASLFSSYYNDHNPIKRNGNSANEKAIDSVFALCPVVDLETSITRLFQQDINGALMRIIFWSELESITKVIPILGDIFRPNGSLAKNPDLPKKIAEQASSYLKNSNSDWKLSPELATPIVDYDQYYELNMFTEYFRHIQDTPVMTSGSKDDWIVLYDQNSKILYEELGKNPGATSIEPLPVDVGNHCALGQGYGWRNIAALYKSFILSHAPEMRARKRVNARPLITFRQDRDFELRTDEQLIKPRWEFSKFRNSAKLHMDLFDPNIKGCSNETRTTDKSKCVRTTSATVNVFDLPRQVRRIPRTDIEAAQFSRWANTNIELTNKVGLAVKTTQGHPTTLRWTSY